MYKRIRYVRIIDSDVPKTAIIMEFLNHRNLKRRMHTQIYNLARRTKETLQKNVDCKKQKFYRLSALDKILMICCKLFHGGSINRTHSRDQLTLIYESLCLFLFRHSRDRDVLR